jgi:hypothetical protein
MAFGAPPGNSMNSGGGGVLRHGGGGSLDDTLAISHHGNMDSFDDLQSSIDTKRMKTYSNVGAMGEQEDLIEVRQFTMREFKEPQIPKEAREKQLLRSEVR